MPAKRVTLWIWAALAVIFAIPAPSPLAAQDQTASENPPAWLNNCMARPEDPVRIARLPACLRSNLGPGDPSFFEGIYYEDYLLHLDDDRTVQIDMDALGGGDAGPSGSAEASAATQGVTILNTGFDTYLQIRTADGERLLAENDDRPDSLNSRLVFTAPATGEYLVRARALGRGTGDYALRLLRVPSPPPPIRITGDRVEDVIGQQNPPSESRDGYRFARYRFDAAAGERVLLTLSSSGERALELRSPEGVSLAADHHNDRETALATTIARSGSYIVRVELRTEGERPEPYGLRLVRSAVVVPAAAPEAQLIELGPNGDQDVQGALRLDSPAMLLDQETGQIESLYQLFAVPVRAGQTIIARVYQPSLDDFDPILDAGALSVLGFATLESNDEFGHSFNAYLRLQAERTGMLHLRVRSDGPGIGNFSLSVSVSDRPPS